MAFPSHSYLVCATPAQRQHAPLPPPRPDRARGPSRGVLRGAAPLRHPAAAARVLRPGAPREHHRAARLPRDARRADARAQPAVAARRLRGLPRVGARGGDDGERRLRREADVGLPRRLRDAAARHRGQRGPARAGAARPLVPRAALRPDHPRGQGPAGRLAVEGRADAGLAAGGRRRPTARRPSRSSPSARSTSSCASSPRTTRHGTPTSSGSASSR